MLVYFMVDFLVAALGVMLVNRGIRIGRNYIQEDGGTKVYFYLMLAMLIYISAFRGDFTSDYTGYEDIFYRFNKITFDAIVKRSLFTYPEKGYLLFQFLINHIFHDVIWLFIVSSIIIVVSNVYQIRKYAPNLMFGLILFVEAGTYYTSFNIMRHILAVSVVIMGSTFLYEKKPFKFFIFVIIAGLIHSAAFFMIPLYFVLHIKIYRKSIVVYPIIFVALVVAMPFLIRFVQRYYWSWYFTGEWQYGGYTWKSVIIPFVMDMYSIISFLMESKAHISKSDSETRAETDELLLNDRENVWLNATFFHLSFVLMGFQLTLMSRFSAFLSLFSILFFCNQVEKSKYRKLIIALTVILATVYCQITRNDYPYYFIWNR
jgi:hypothetical protein